MKTKIGRGMIKKFFITLVFLIIAAATPIKVESAEVNAYFFYGEGCPHCSVEQKFLFEEQIKSVWPLSVYEYEIYNNQSNLHLLQKVGHKLGVDVGGVPFLVIGDRPFVGYSPSVSETAIRRRVKECATASCPDSVASIVGVKGALPVPDSNVTLSSSSETISPSELDEKKDTSASVPGAVTTPIRVPLLGNIAPEGFSLPILTVIMGTLDGFNPCALWTLLFLISLLLGMKDRKRMWLLGGAFIFASAAVYFLFMVTWLKLILFLGFVMGVRYAIGLLAISGGAYSLKEFFVNKDGVCKVTGSKKRQIIFEKLKLAVQENSLWLALGGIMVLAFAVNLVELICSAGLPAVYTQVLALNQMPLWQYYFYILLYILFFMLDDLFIFFVVMITLEMTGVTTKYTKISRLVGGIIMVTIGLLLIFKPAWLMFG